MKCEICGRETIRLIYKYEDGTVGAVGKCTSCVDLTPLVDYRGKTTLTLNNGSQITAGSAHISDIKHRKIGEGGKVYRDTKKTYFCSTSTGGK